MKASDFSDEDIRQCIRAANEAAGQPPFHADRLVLVALEGRCTGSWAETVREKAAAILAARESARQPKRERLGAWVCRYDEWIRLPVGRNDFIGAAAMKGGRWLVVDSGGRTVGDEQATDLPAAKAAADAAAIAHGYELEGGPHAPTVTVSLGGTVTVYSMQPSTEGWDVVPSPADRLRSATDAALRFCLGMPRGERWMGRQAWRAVAITGASFRPDGCGMGNPALLPQMSAVLLCVLTAIDPASTRLHLSAEEQREYLRLVAALRAAVRPSDRSGR